MTVKFTSVHTKRTKNYDFFEDTPEFTQYIIETYVNTNKCLEWRKVEFPDSDTMVITSTWTSTTSYLEALDDPIVIKNIQDRNNYYLINCGLQITLSTSMSRE
jgi:hypothetical protein